MSVAMPDISKIVQQVFMERTLLFSAKGTGCILRDDAVAANRSVVNSMIRGGAERISAGPGIINHPQFDTDLASKIDHTNLKPEATTADIKQLCEEARTYGFASVCVQPSNLAICKSELEGTAVKICTVIGFPHGASTTETKVFETQQVLNSGADELDIVMNIGKLKSGDNEYVLQELRSIVRVTKKWNITKVVKVILEACFLTDKEKVISCILARDAGADYVKTSTGFGSDGATLGDVALMRKVVGSGMQIKAAGGIKTASEASAFNEIGADRIGASASIKIVHG